MEKKDLRLARERRRRKENRLAILKAAEAVILRKGYTALTMDDVAQEAEFSKATLYHYFKSKGELIVEIIAQLFEEIDQELNRIKGLNVSAREKLRQGIRYYLSFHQEKENISRVLMMDRSFMEKMKIFVTEEKKLTSEMDKKFISRIKTRRKEILAGVDEIMKEGIDAGEFREMDVTAAVILFEALLQGYCHATFWQDRRYSIDDAAELIHEFFLQGIEKKKSKVKGEQR